MVVKDNFFYCSPALSGGTLHYQLVVVKENKVLKLRGLGQFKIGKEDLYVGRIWGNSLGTNLRTWSVCLRGSPG